MAEPIDRQAVEDLELDIERSGINDEPTRCGAKCKRDVNRPNLVRYCTRRCMPNKKRCRLHNGRSSNQPNNTVTHGTSSKYIALELLPAIIERAVAMRTIKGKEKVLLMGAAVMEHRLERVPDDPEYIKAYTEGRKSVREDLKLGHEITKEDKPVEPGTTIQVYAPGAIDVRFRRFDARGAQGIVTIQMIDGVAWILDGEDTLRRAHMSVDGDSGAEIYGALMSDTSVNTPALV